MKKLLLIVFCMILLIPPIYAASTQYLNYDVIQGTARVQQSQATAVDYLAASRQVRSEADGNRRIYIFVNMSNVTLTAGQYISNADLVYTIYYSNSIDGTHYLKYYYANYDAAFRWNGNDTYFNNQPCGDGEVKSVGDCSGVEVDSFLMNNGDRVYQGICNPNCPNVSIDITSQVNTELTAGDGVFLILFQIEDEDGGGLESGIEMKYHATKRPLINYTISDAPDTTPPNVTIFSPTNNTRVNNIPLLINVSVNETSTCKLINTSSNGVLDTKAVTDSANLQVNTTLNEYYTLQFLINCTDTSDNSGYSVLNLSIDTTAPALTITNPINKSTYKNIPLDITCTDTDIYRLNYTLSKGGAVNQSFENVTPTGTELSIKRTLTGLSSFNWTLDIECTDSHTNEEISPYIVEKNVPEKSLTYTKDGEDLKISLKSTTATLSDFSTEKLTDRYIFDYDFVNSGLELNQYTFTIEAAQLVYLASSKYKGHFILPKSSRWLDFDLNDKNAIYSAKKISSSVYEMVITTSLSHLEFNSVGDLNVMKAHYEVETDNTPPYLAASIPSTIYDNYDNISFEVNCTDYSGIDNISLFDNRTGAFIFRLGYNSPNTPFYMNTTATIGDINNRIDCFDTIGNNISVFLSYWGNDTSVPIIPANETLSYLTCSTNTSSSMYLLIFVVIALFLIIIGFMYRVGIIGVLGAIGLLILSLYISPCIHLFGYFVGIVSAFLIIYFAAFGLGFLD